MDVRSSTVHEKREQQERPGESPSTARAREREIDEVLENSFPASDPPPWTLGVEEEPPDRKPGPRKLGSGVI